MRHVVHHSRKVHGLALLLALLFATQPTSLYAPGVQPSAAALQLQAQATQLLQGFWETVALYAGR
jgi:hypothetical protein